MIKMPGRTYSGPLPPLTATQTVVRDQLVRDVKRLASEIGERNVWLYHNLTAASDFIEVSLTATGYSVNRQIFHAEGRICSLIRNNRESSGNVPVVTESYERPWSSAL